MAVLIFLKFLDFEQNPYSRTSSLVVTLHFLFFIPPWGAEENDRFSGVRH